MCKFFLTILIIGISFSAIGQTPMRALIAKKADYTTGLRLSIDASTITGLVDDDPVSTWPDLSGNSNDLTATTTLRPLYKTNILNAKPVVRFDGVNDVMAKATPAGLDGGTGMTIFIVVKNPGINLNAYLAKWDYQTQGSWIWATFVTDETRMYIAPTLTDNGSTYKTTSTSDMASGTWYLLEMVYDGSQGTASDRVKIYRNGTLVTQAATGTIPTSLVSSTATLKLGRAGGTLAWYFTGDFAAVRIYDHAVSDANRLIVRTKMNSEWAVF